MEVKPYYILIKSIFYVTDICFFIGYVNTVLSAPILYPISRVTYCAYLIHPIVIRFMTMTMDHPLHLGKVVMIMIFIGLTFASYVIAFVISVTFEAPVVSMLRILTKLAPPQSKK